MNNMEMTIEELLQLGYLAENAYSAPGLGWAQLPENFRLLEQAGNVFNGYNGFSAYNEETNTLVVSSAGTNPRNPIDILQDIDLATIGGTLQFFSALELTNISLSQLSLDGIVDPNIQFVGHSLGGAISNFLSTKFSNSSAVVFNSPGAGGW